MKKIIFDLQPLQPQDKSKYHGGGEYGKQVFKFILNHIKNFKLICIYNKDLFLDDKIKATLEKNNIPLQEYKNSNLLEELIHKNKIDIFYTALPRMEYLDITFKKVRYIFPLHDLRVLETPTDRYEHIYVDKVKDKFKCYIKFLFKKYYVKRAKKGMEKLIVKSNKIITISEHSKYSIMENYSKINDKDISIIPSPLNIYMISKNEELKSKEKYSIKASSYFLLISGGRWIKNSFRALKALDKIYSERPDIEKDTIIIGDLNLDKFKLENKNRFKTLGYLKRDELEYFYKNAFAFIYPTLNEGYGYPPIEAMKYGKPVLTSGLTSVPEVCGDAPLYFNPYSIKEIKNRILNIYYNVEIYNRCKEKGLKKFQEIEKIQKNIEKKYIEEFLN